MGLGATVKSQDSRPGRLGKGGLRGIEGIWLEVEGGPGALRTGRTCLTRSAGSWRESKERTGEKEGERAGKARATKPSRGRTGGQGKKQQVGVGEGSGIEERDKKEGGREELEMGVGQSFTGVWGGVWAGGWGGPPPATHTGLSHTTRQRTHSSKHVQTHLASLFSGPLILQPTGPGPPLASGSMGL